MLTRPSNKVFKITPGGMITEIIDFTGDGAGNKFASPFGVATDVSGNVFVPGSRTHNAFKITPGGTITQIIDRAGDGAGNTLSDPRRVATDVSGNVFVTGGNNVFKITAGSATAAEQSGSGIPTSYALQANYPNPFNPTTTIRYDLPEVADVRLVVFDVLGRGVAELVNGQKPAGRHEVVWDATGWASGVYFYHLKAGGFVQSRAAYLSK